MGGDDETVGGRQLWQGCEALEQGEGEGQGGSRDGVEKMSASGLVANLGIERSAGVFHVLVDLCFFAE